VFRLHRLNPANKCKECFQVSQALSPRIRDPSLHLLLRSVKAGLSVGCVRADSERSPESGRRSHPHPYPMI